ncbi:trypsin-like peptidase domain-containing protein [Rhodobacter sp. Har01]|uniref:trypsin-like peptidase domain-containing protein n=1 Tax=Rhodobacter sp. Har01 TaxID=2883999 RepID=UPI001D06B58B|nr:trypsin-like peptidase domain-containing protein [Rhodobacter sp. Har01]MCB6180019.1 trypsin-like peptidase domain-containing protein [Rhodobacter sp. Har01]
MIRLFRAPILALAASLPLAAPAETTVPANQAEIALSFAPVVQATAPAVVNIYARQVVQDRVSPFAGDPFFDQFFEEFGATQPRIQNSLGSGVIVSADGIVVSNYHVVADATDIRVVLADRREYAATLLLADPQADLAILKVAAEAPLPALELGDSEALQVGDLVLAIGNPFGVGQTVSSGIVSGLARSALQVGDGTGYFVQTDAPINPGNSGGALVDMAGRLVGINTAIVTRDGGSNGIGFAIPSDLVAAVVAQAQAGETQFTRPWAGLTGQEVDGALAEALGMARPLGVLITAMHPQSPFAAAGLAEGDVVLSLGGAAINTPQEFLFRLSVLGAGTAQEVRYLHDGAEAVAQVAMAAAPDTPDRLALQVTQDVILRGATLARINPAVMSELGLSLDARGVALIATQDIAREVGLQPGDILVAINGQPVSTPDEALAAASVASRRWQIDLIRAGQPLRLRFRL